MTGLKLTGRFMEDLAAMASHLGVQQDPATLTMCSLTVARLMDWDYFEKAKPAPISPKYVHLIAAFALVTMHPGGFYCPQVKQCFRFADGKMHVEPISDEMMAFLAQSTGPIALIEIDDPAAPPLSPRNTLDPSVN